MDDERRVVCGENKCIVLYYPCGWFRKEKGKGKTSLGLSKREYYI